MQTKSLPSSVYGLPQKRKSEVRSRKAFCRQAGQSLIEVIIAATVGVLVVTALTFATIFSLRNASFAKNSAQATKLAQEGIERVRSGRDRNLAIGRLGSITSWDGSSSVACSGPTVKSDSIWCYQINSTCNPNCYFNVTNAGALKSLGAGSSIPAFAELILPNFKRVVILSDDESSYTDQKKVTVVVQWTDFAGPHESKLTTILRRL